MAAKIIYTETDEAPMLATYSLLPVIQRFAKPSGIEVSNKTSISCDITVNTITHASPTKQKYQCISLESNFFQFDRNYFIFRSKKGTYRYPVVLLHVFLKDSAQNKGSLMNCQLWEK